MTEDERLQLEKRLKRFDLDQLLADQANTFQSTVGGPASHRRYTTDWVAKRLKRRKNTEIALSYGRDWIQGETVKKISDHTAGNPLKNILFGALVDELDLDEAEVQGAVQFLVSKGLVEFRGVATVALTQDGWKWIENTRRRTALNQQPIDDETHRRTEEALNGGMRAFRDGVLLFIYDYSTGGANAFWTGEVAKEMGLSPDQVDAAIDYLHSKGYFVEWGMHSLQLNAHGIDAAEAIRHGSPANYQAAIHVQNLNVSGGNVAFAQGRNVTQSQVNEQVLPQEIQGLGARLKDLEGGVLSPASADLLKSLAEPKSALALAAAIEPVAAKSQSHANLLTEFGQGLAKKAGEMSMTGAVAAAGWAVTHSHVVVKALEIWQSQH
jgi:Mn-dependent DtxR family transcriptional regulator